MAKKKSTSQKEQDAIKDFIRDSGISLTEARMMLQEARKNADRFEDDDVQDFSSGGMPTKKYVNPVTITDNRKKKR